MDCVRKENTGLTLGTTAVVVVDSVELIVDVSELDPLGAVGKVITTVVVSGMLVGSVGRSGVLCKFTVNIQYAL